MFLCIIKSFTMKKIIKNSNPFILILLPVAFALVMAISYQVEQKKYYSDNSSVPHATSLFFKGVGLVKTVCAIAKEKVW